MRKTIFAEWAVYFDSNGKVVSGLSYLHKNFKSRGNKWNYRHSGTEDMESLRRLIQFQTSERDSSQSSCLLASSAAIPSFLWPNYWSRLCTFFVANALPDQHKAQVFLLDQTAAIYKQLVNLATQQAA